MIKSNKAVIPTAAQEVRDSNGVTPCIVMKMMGFCTTKSRFSAASMRLLSLRQSERTTARDPVQHKRCSGQYETSKMDALMVYDAFQTFVKR